MTDIEWTLKQLRRIKEAINFIADVVSTEPTTLSEKAKFFDKLSEISETVDTLADMTKTYFCHENSSKLE